MWKLSNFVQIHLRMGKTLAESEEPKRTDGQKKSPENTTQPERRKVGRPRIYRNDKDAPSYYSQVKEKSKTNGARRLEFFTQIIKAYGYNIQKLASMSEYSQQNLYYTVHVRDNCKLSKIEYLLKLCSLDLHAKICNRSGNWFTVNVPKQLPKIEYTTSEGARVEIAGMLPATVESSVKHTKEPPKIPIPEYIANNRGRRLSFLANYLNTYLTATGKTLFRLEKELGYSQSAFYYMFVVTDDIDIEKLYEIVAWTCGTIEWSVTAAVQED